MTLECRLHDPALHAVPAAVHEPQLAQPGLMRGADVLFDDDGDISRREGVQVELRFYRDLMSHDGCDVLLG